MVENGWKLHLDNELDFVNKSCWCSCSANNLKNAMLCLAAHAAAIAVAIVTLARCFL